eukprot:1044144-Rhodomonas_salina.1
MANSGFSFAFGVRVLFDLWSDACAVSAVACAHPLSAEPQSVQCLSLATPVHGTLLTQLQFMKRCPPLHSTLTCRVH